MTTRYSTVAIILHWTIAALLVSMIFFGWYADDLREALPEGVATLDEVVTAFSWHKTFGILVLLLSLVRLGWRLTHKSPPLPDAMPAWEAFAARFTHVAFYVLMIGMPLLGWLAASSSGIGSFLFDNPQMVLPDLPVPESEALHDTTAWLHGRGAWAILILLGLHAAAALKHHILDKDDVLRHMLPFLPRL